MTAAEIAKIAGVSRSTVTGVINDYSFISEETKKKIRAIIEEYGYVPNSAARHLVGKTPKVIGLFLYVLEDIQTSAYFSSLIVDVIDRAQTLGYSVMTSLVKNLETKQVLTFLQNGSVSGAIISGGGIDEAEVSDLLKSAFPLVFVDKLFSDREISGRKSIVNRNNFRGAYLATKYLLEMGHADIVYIHGIPNRLSSIERLHGYQKALQDSGKAVVAEHILPGDFSDQTAEKVMTDFITKKHVPSAIFAINDMSAIGAIRALKKKNIHVPDDVSVVGFDDLLISNEIEPKLTTVRANTEMVATEAVERLIKMLEHPNIGASKSVIEPVLVERESVRRKG